MPDAIVPARMQEILAEVAQGENDRFNAALKDALDEGWLIWSMHSPQARLKAYEQATLPADLPLVLTDGYLALWQRGILPQLQALAAWQAATQLSQQTGQPIQATTQMFWAMLLVLPQWIFLHFQKDFAALVKAKLRKELAGADLPESAPMLPARSLSGANTGAQPLVP